MNTLFPSARLPITAISDFFRAAKTALFNHIFNIREGRCLAVIVNDMSPVNIDANLMRKFNAEPLQEGI